MSSAFLCATLTIVSNSTTALALTPCSSQLTANISKKDKAVCFQTQVTAFLIYSSVLVLVMVVVVHRCSHHCWEGQQMPSSKMQNTHTRVETQACTTQLFKCIQDSTCISSVMPKQSNNHRL
eukprot:4283527-Amphidinium_carterae.1